MKKITLVLTLMLPLMIQANTTAQSQKNELKQNLIKQLNTKKDVHFKKTKYAKSTKNTASKTKYAKNTTAKKSYTRVQKVTATAYTSSPRETQGDPTIGAWGNKLRPGVKSIAISRDLLQRGMKNGTRVKIDGLSGTYIVRDKMAARWRNKIDIYMGYSRSRAMNWGRRSVVIRWA